MLNEIDDLRKDLREYLEVKVDLVRLHLAENLSRILSNMASSAIIGYLLFLIIMFLSLTAGYFIGSRLNSTELGFLCVSGFYVMLLIIFLLLRKKIVEKPVVRTIIRLLFPKFKDNEEK
jgi:hypothetical protein